MHSNFQECLTVSHAAEDLALWESIYRKAFPSFVSMASHRQNGDHQKHGIDRSITLTNSKQLLIDEKARGTNKKTGKVYGDIALEFLSNAERNVPGWVCKPLLADYIAYGILPLGKCYMLPVLQLQLAWQQRGDRWRGQYGEREATTQVRGGFYTTRFCPVPAEELFPAIGSCLRVSFTPIECIEA